MADMRTALITGASAGIGAALARKLARRGVEVALCARRADALEEVARSIEADGGRARVYPLDVSDPAAVHQVLREADDAMDGIDVVVANAGIGKGRWAGKLTWDDLEPTLMLNVIGATATLTALLPRMVRRKRGHIVGISSLAGTCGLPKTAAYSASKAYLSVFLQSLRVDLRTTGVAVSDIRPGYIRTDLTDAMASLPMLMDLEPAVVAIEAAIVARKPVHAFPFVMATLVKSLAALPPGIYDRVAPKVT